MRHTTSMPILVCAALLGLALTPQATEAAEVTDVLDAFDHAANNPYDLSLRLRFVKDTRGAAIAREVRCLKQDRIGANHCADGSKTVFARELAYERTRNVMNIDIRIGIHHDVELYTFLPIVLADSWNHEFSDGVTRQNSTIYPPSNLNALFAVPYQSKERAGFGDMALGIKWAPFNYYRDRAHPTWVLGVQYTLPTGTPMRADNTDVGYGIHELELYSTISRRTLRVLEPFFTLHGILRFGADKGLFVKTTQTQVRSAPGSSIGTSFGIDVIPWEDLEQDARVELEMGFRMDYVFRGREYSEVWEALASPDNPCSLETGCTNTLHSKSQVDTKTGQHHRTDGVTDVEQYGQFNGWGSLHYQPMRNFQVSLSVGYTVESPHFITFGDYGKDRDGKSGVQEANTENPPQNEYSPTFLPALDTPGNRLRVQDVSAWTVMFALGGKL